jgi:hypothetical protein
MFMSSSANADNCTPASQTSFTSISWDDLLALAADANNFKVIPRPLSSMQHMSHSQLPNVVQDVNMLRDAMIAQVVSAFFEARSSPVIHRCDTINNPPAGPAPVVKVDGEVYEADIDPQLRWYFVLRGRNVGVVQGE